MTRRHLAYYLPRQVLRATHIWWKLKHGALLGTYVGVLVGPTRSLARGIIRPALACVRACVRACVTRVQARPWGIPHAGVRVGLFLTINWHTPHPTAEAAHWTAMALGWIGRYIGRYMHAAWACGPMQMPRGCLDQYVCSLLATTYLPR